MIDFVQIPSCSRCITKGLLCEARSTKRASDAATRMARKQFSLYRRPVPIVSANQRLPSPPMTAPFTSTPDPLSTWSCIPATSWPYAMSPSMTYPYAPPNTANETDLVSGALFASERMLGSFDFACSQTSPASVYSCPAYLETGAVQPPGSGFPGAGFRLTPPASRCGSECDSMTAYNGLHPSFQLEQPSQSMSTADARTFELDNSRQPSGHLSQLPLSCLLGDFGSMG